MFCLMEYITHSDENHQQKESNQFLFQIIRYTHVLQLIIDNIDLLDNLHLRLLNRRTKQLFDNNLYWLKQIENITVDYKYFIKKEEEISYFDLYFRIDQMTFPIKEIPCNILSDSKFTLIFPRNVTVKLIRYNETHYTKSCNLIFIHFDKTIKNYCLKFTSYDVFVQTNLEVNFKIQPYHKNIGTNILKNRKHDNFCSRLIEYEETKSNSKCVLQ